MYNSSYANQFLLLGIIKGFYLLSFANGQCFLSPPHIDMSLYGVYQYETGDSKGTLSLLQGILRGRRPLK